MRNLVRYRRISDIELAINLELWYGAMLVRPGALNNLGCALVQQRQPTSRPSSRGRSAEPCRDTSMKRSPASSSTAASASSRCPPTWRGRRSASCNGRSTPRAPRARPRRSAATRVLDSSPSARASSNPSRRIRPRQCPALPPAAFSRTEKSWTIRDAIPIRSRPRPRHDKRIRRPHLTAIGKPLLVAAIEFCHAGVGRAAEMDDGHLWNSRRR